MLGSMEDGEISISAYDTAWVTLVEDTGGSGDPQFPSSLQWIANNQLEDGSWGIAFIKENISKLEDEKAEHVPIVFEVAFPSLIEIARKLGIQVPDDSPVLQEIYARRNLKLRRYWTEEGICWARNLRVRDSDDTVMGFRLLRLQGHQVSADVFRNFEKSGDFFCFVGQSTQAVTGMFNLYRASQVLFPGEKILEDAKKFSSKFLREKRASNELLDKWIITKDLPGEVGYGLDVPWNASLLRLETRFYLEQYGGEDDVWIGKTLYSDLVGARLQDRGVPLDVGGGLG
ncbi:terpenoid cyclases/Protein prenyltransferases superfamily protein [Actinidia rufa]|uniref:Terpenoid cyclases/Protein prenyltransferases superfamily protein n=1 Tax=Actinidia rufa TaxID=165716 RepID=A0A7J0FR25_9ERIC|nr:terpenoid cyclases/Protein prenyltransferases superfamily protein [Actinidia rufa]